MPRKPPMWKRRVNIPGLGALVEGHIRFSSENQRDTLTAESQRRVIREYCERRGWKIASWNVEDAVSGGAETLQARPLWLAHIARIGKEVHISVCVDLFRWSRDPGSIYESLRRIREQGGYWITCDEQHALDKIETDYGAQFGLAVSAVTAKQQLSATSARTHMGKITRSQLGLHNGPVMFGYRRAPIPPPPPGYDLMTYRVTQRLPVVPDDALIASAQMTRFEALVKIGELRAEGLSYGAIAQWLNERGAYPTFRQAHKTRITTSFTPLAIYGLLSSSFPREFVRADGVPSGHGTIHNPDNDHALEGAHTCAWSAARCLKIDQVNEARRDYRGKSRETHTERRRTGYYKALARPYSGLLICHTCQSPVTIHTITNYQDTAHQLKVHCSAGGGGNVDEVNLDANIYWLLHIGVHEHQQQQIDQRATHYRPPQRKEPDPQQAQRITELRAERDRWSKLYAKGLITEAEVTEQLSAIKKELQPLQTPTLPTPAVTDETFLQAGQQWLQISELWEAMTPAERGKMLGFMFEPRSIAVNIHDRHITRIRPKPPFDGIIAAILNASPDHEGWLDIPLPDVQEHAKVIARFGAQRGIALTPRMLGIAHRGKWYVPESLITQMRALRRQGKGYKYIAKVCHVAVGTARKYTQGIIESLTTPLT